jgi:HEAT repeat protein
MEDGASADARRRGINDLVRWDFALDGPYVKRYRQIATGDPDPLVRATAIRALNRARDAQARPIFINALRDASVDVRIEAAKALDNLPDPNAADPLVRTVANPDEDRDVRIAAASALRHYKSLEVARALIPRLNEHDFAIAWQSRRTLRQITGKDMRYNEAAWLAFVSGPDKPLG